MVAAVIAGGIAAVNKGTSELPVYTVAAERMLEGAPIYRVEDQKPFTYPPFFAVPFIPLVWLPRDGAAARLVWYAVSVAALASILLMIGRIVGPAVCLSPRRSGVRDRGPRAWVLWAAVLLLSGRHLLAPLENQSHDLIVALLIVLGVRAAGRGRELRAGAWLGLAVACKATPILFVPVLVWQRRLVASGAAVAAAVLALWLPDLILPPASGESWTWQWYETFLRGIAPGRTAQAEGAWQSWNLLNQNLAGTLYRLATPVLSDGRWLYDVQLIEVRGELLRSITLVAQLAVLAVVLAATLPRWTRGLAREELALRRLGEAGAVACGMVLLSPMSSKSHFCVLVMAAAFCVTDWLYRRRDAVLGVLLAVVLLSGTLTVKGLWGRDLGNLLLGYGVVAWSAVALLLATAYALWQRGRARHGALARSPASSAC